MKHTSYLSLRWQWANSARKTAQTCGKIPIHGNNWIDVYHSKHPTQGGQYHFGGLVKCGSSAICASCSQEFAQKRIAFTEQVFHKATLEGMEIKMATFTTRHNADTPLKPLYHAMGTSFSNILGQSELRRLRKLGMKYIRSLETTWGYSNGYHPHYHVAFLVPVGTVIDFDSIYEDWKEAITSWGFEAPDRENGLFVSELETNQEALAEYLNKTRSMAHLELAGGVMKKAKSEHYSIWEIRALAEKGEIWAKDIWREYELAIKSINIFSFSRSIKADWALHPDSPALYIMLTEKEKAEQVFVVSIHAQLWRFLIEKNQLFRFLNDASFAQVTISMLRRSGYKSRLTRDTPQNEELTLAA